LTLITLFPLLLLALTLAGAPSVAAGVGVGEFLPAADTGPVASGEPFARRVTHLGQPYDILLVPLDRFEVRMHRSDGAGREYNSLNALAANLEKSGAKPVMVTNAGMFRPDYAPLGLHVEGGKTLAPLNLVRGRGGNFSMKPNGVLAITDERAHIVRSEEYPELNGKTLTATQSGPMLVIDGAIHPDFRPSSASRHIRSGVGLRGPRELVFAISRELVNFHDFATLFRDTLGCSNALYLDGSISDMYLPALGRYWSWQRFGGLISVTERQTRAAEGEP